MLRSKEVIISLFVITVISSTALGTVAVTGGSAGTHYRISGINVYILDEPYSYNSVYYILFLTHI